MSNYKFLIMETNNFKDQFMSTSNTMKKALLLTQSMTK